MNCGERRDFDACRNCGLTKTEDAQVHDELRQMINPNASFMDAARHANRIGRRLLALKLASAAAATTEAQDESDVARALRVWLLSAIGESQSGLDDAKAWVDGTQNPSAIAWASYGQQLQQGGFPGASADAYEKALKKKGDQHNIRARRSQLLLELGRGGQALDESIKVFTAQGVDEASVQLVCQVAEDLCSRFESQYRDDEISRLLDYAGEHAERSPALLAQRARLAALEGDTTAAKRDLKMARRLNPELEIYERVERALKPARSSWWRW